MRGSIRRASVGPETLVHRLDRSRQADMRAAAERIVPVAQSNTVLPRRCMVGKELSPTLLGLISSRALRAFAAAGGPVRCRLRVTSGKTLCEYMFSELPQIPDIVGSAGCPRTACGRIVVLRRSARGARKPAGEGGDQCALTPCRGRNGAEQLTPLGALEHRRPAGLHHVLSVRAHPMPVSWARRGRSQASRRGDRYRLMRSEGRFAEKRPVLEQSMPAPGMSRACPGRWQATAVAPFCQTRQ
jgi:hypothetical protein